MWQEIKDNVWAVLTILPAVILACVLFATGAFVIVWVACKILGIGIE